MYDYYDYNTNYYTTGVNLGGIFAMSSAFLIIGGLLGILMIISIWKIFKKAGKPGWASIVPIYNIIVLLEVAELPLWYIVLFLIPFANIYAFFKIYIELAHKFGKSTGFGVASVFFSAICLPILAFGKSVYKGGMSSASSSVNENFVNNEANYTQMNNEQNNDNQVNNAQMNNEQNNDNQVNNAQINNEQNTDNQVNNIQMNNEQNNDNRSFNDFNIQSPNNQSSNAVNSNEGNNLVSEFKPIGNVNVEAIDDQPTENLNSSITDTNMPNNLSNSQMPTKRCPRCGKELPMIASICDNCGQQL